MTILRESTNLLPPRLMEFTVALADVERGFEPGTGTLIAIAKRVFIATAGHVIPAKPNKRLFVATKEGKRPADGMVAFSRYASLTRPDVGYLEIDAPVALPFLKKNACPLDRIADYGMGRTRRPALLLGVSSSESGVEGERSVRLGVVGYECDPLSPTEIKTKCPDPPCDETVDVFLDYEFSDCRRNDTYEQIEAPDPSGMSGGGVWDQGFDGEIWHPDKAKLFAIQSLRAPDNRYLRATQIIHWLRLVYRDYRDLQAILSDRWPKLAAGMSGSARRLDCDLATST